MKTVEVVTARGHENITATNNSTFEITKERHLTKRGDCIVAVGADKSTKDFSDEFKKALTERDTKLIIVIEAGDEKEVVEAWGATGLTLNHPTDLVVRKSSYVCDRTLAVKATKAAEDFSRTLVRKLGNPHQRVHVTLALGKHEHNTRDAHSNAAIP